MSQTLSAVYPWQSGQKLTAAALDAKFAALDALLANQASQITALQTQTQESNLGTAITVSWGGNTNVAAGPEQLVATAPYAFTILSMAASVGTTGGSFVATVLNNGVPIDGLNQVAITSPTRTTFTAVSNRSVAPGSELSLQISNVVGLPSNAWLSLTGSTNAIPDQSLGTGRGIAVGYSPALGMSTQTYGGQAFGTAIAGCIVQSQGWGTVQVIGNTAGRGDAGAIGVTLQLGRSYGAAAGGCTVQGVGSYSTGPNTLSLDSGALDTNPLG